MGRPPQSDLQVGAASATETQHLGERLGRLLEIGDAIGLLGGLGSGKTTFAQGMARGLEVPATRHVASPTFALVNEHPGRVPFVHADLYRVADATELAELGLGEACDRAAVAVEWLDRFPDALPADRLEIELRAQPDGGRILLVRPAGARSAALAERWLRA